MMPLISAGRRPSYFQWRGYLASPSRSRSRGEGQASSGDGCRVPGAGPPPSAGGHCHRPRQPTRRRCPKCQPSWLPAWGETHENRRQIINDGKKQSAAGCRGGQVTAPACSPYGRDAFFISYKEIPPMETLCSSGAAGSLLPHLCLSKDRKRQSLELQNRGRAR